VLLANRFIPIPVDNPATFHFLAGDVVVIQPCKSGKHPDGHIAGYDGIHWLSDFVQHGFWPADDYLNERAHYAVYRY
jgi:hypothetical protein